MDRSQKQWWVKRRRGRFIAQHHAYKLQPLIHTKQATYITRIHPYKGILNTLGQGEKGTRNGVGHKGEKDSVRWMMMCCDPRRDSRDSRRVTHVCAHTRTHTQPEGKQKIEIWIFLTTVYTSVKTLDNLNFSLWLNKTTNKMLLNVQHYSGLSGWVVAPHFSSTKEVT